MKKLGVAVAAVLLSAMVVPANAFETKFSGEFRTRGEYFNEHFMENDFYTDLFLDPSTGDQNDFADRESSLWDSRMRLKMEFAANENLKGVYVLEVGDITWGGNITDSPIYPDLNNGTFFVDGRSRDESLAGQTPYSDGIGNDAINLETKHMYIDFTLPDTPVNAKIGLLPMKFGHGIVLDHDVAGLILQVKTDTVTAGAGTFKTSEGNSQTSNDNDFYTLFANLSLQDKGSIGLFGIMGVIGDPAQFSSYTKSDLRNKANYWWAGLSGDLNLDPVTIAFEADGFWADFDLVSDFPGDGFGKDLEAEGYAAYLDIAANLQPVKVGVAGLFATGETLNQSTGDRVNRGPDGFAPLRPTDSEDRALLDWDNMFLVDLNQNFLSNLISGKLYVQISPSDSVTVGISGQSYWLEESAMGVGNGRGSYIGTEADLDLTVQIYENLAYKVAGAYMFTSDQVFGVEAGVDVFDSNGSFVGTADKDYDSEDIWFLGHQLIYTF
jgi:hypothetical protein